MVGKKFAFGVFVLLVTFVVSPGLVHAGDPVATGKNLYKTYCLICHGDSGKGDGKNGEFLDPTPRDLTDHGEKPYMIKRTNAEFFKAISMGGREIEKSGLMPPFNKTLSEDEIWSLVAYIKTFYKPTIEAVKFGSFGTTRADVKVGSPEIPEASRRDKMVGKRVYGKYGCSGCHKIKGRGGVSGPDLMGVGAKLKPAQIYTVIQNSRSVKADSEMPVYDLNEDTAISITKYLTTLK